jgi:hypothetical protein
MKSKGKIVSIKGSIGTANNKHKTQSCFDTGQKNADTIMLGPLCDGKFGT